MSELAAKWKRIAKRFREYEAEMEAGAIFDCAFSPFELTAAPEEAEQIATALAAQQDGAWQPIKTAPKGEWIVGYVSWGQNVGKFHEHSGPCEWVRDHHEFVDVDFDVFPGPTHWLPYRKDRPADVFGHEQAGDGK